MASITKRGQRYWVRWWEGGRSRSLTVGSKREALRRKVEIEDALDREGRYEPRRAGRSTPLDLALADFIAHSGRTHRPNTTKRYAQMLELFRRWMGAGARTEALSYALLGDYLRHLEAPETGRHLHGRGAETCRKHIQAIELFWRWAWQRQARGEYVGVPQPDSLGLKRPPPPMRLAPTWEEMDACIAASTGWLRKLYVVMRCTGLRVDSQALALTWNDVDLERRRLRIRPELGKTAAERRGRWIPLAPALAEELAGWGLREGFLVPCPRAKREARARDAARAWTRAGVDEAKWKGSAHHCFRAGFQSGLKRMGADDEAVKYLVGHSLGIREHYLDPAALPLAEVVAMVPVIGGSCTDRVQEFRRASISGDQG